MHFLQRNREAFSHHNKEKLEVLDVTGFNCSGLRMLPKGNVVEGAQRME
jgi:hypothetical protein